MLAKNQKKFQLPTQIHGFVAFHLSKKEKDTDMLTLQMCSNSSR